MEDKKIEEVLQEIRKDVKKSSREFKKAADRLAKGW